MVTSRRQVEATQVEDTQTAEPTEAYQSQMWNGKSKGSVDPGPNKRIQGGLPSTRLILSASVIGNAEAFADLASLHIPDGSRVADVTYGKGVFWQKIRAGRYDLTFSDIDAKVSRDAVHGIPVLTGVDCRKLPYEDGAFDCVVFDPPYMEGLFRRDSDHMAGSGTHSAFRHAYSNGKRTSLDSDAPKWHDAVVDLYVKTAPELIRTVKQGGTIIVKCQDEVSANVQRLTHVEIISAYESRGLYTKDLFVVVRPNRPVVSRLKTQVHARKNHSYFLVFSRVRSRVSNVISLQREHPKGQTDHQ